MFRDSSRRKLDFYCFLRPESAYMRYVSVNLKLAVRLRLILEIELTVYL